MAISESIILKGKNETKAAFSELERDARKAAGTLKKDVAEGATKAASSTGALQSVVGQLVETGVFLALAKGAIDFGKASIQTASNVEEMTSKFNVVFGDAAPKAQKALENFGTAVNRSRFDLMEMAASVQDTFVPLGFARDQAADMSVTLVELATDVASFNNSLDVDVMRDFQSALVGNHETVRKYGIVISEATLKQELARMGMANLEGAALEQAKVQARLNLILAGTTDAQGDAARTADSYANVSRGLEAATKDLSAALGNYFLPSVTDAKVAMIPMVELLAKAISVENAWIQAQKQGIVSQGVANDAINHFTWSSQTAEESLKELNELTKLHDRVVSANTDTYAQYVGLFDQYALKTGKYTEVLDDYGTHTQIMINRTGMLTEEQYRLQREEEQLIAVRSQSRSQVIEATADVDALGSAYLNYHARMSEAVAEEARSAVNLREMKSNWETLLGVLDRQVESPIASFIKDLEWLQAGGGQINLAFEEIKKGVTEGTISPEEAKPMLQGLYIAALDVKEEIGQVDIWEAAKQGAEDMGMKAGEVKSMIEGTEGVTGALARVGEIETVLGIDAKALTDAIGYADTMKARQEEIAARKVKPDVDTSGLQGGINKADELDRALGRIDKKIDIYVEYHVTGNPPGGQHGLHMIVPPGFPNDTFPVMASSGEKVDIGPGAATSPGIGAGTAFGGGGDTYIDVGGILIVPPRGTSARATAAETAAALAQLRLGSRASRYAR